MLLIAVAALAEGLDSVLNWLGIGLFALAAAAYTALAYREQLQDERQQAGAASSAEQPPAAACKAGADEMGRAEPTERTALVASADGAVSPQQSDGAGADGQRGAARGVWPLQNFGSGSSLMGSFSFRSQESGGSATSRLFGLGGDP